MFAMSKKNDTNFITIKNKKKCQKISHPQKSS